MSKASATRKANADAREAEIKNAYKDGLAAGHKSGFDKGYEAAKLQAFKALAAEGKQFIVMPEVAKYILPLVNRRMVDLGVTMSGEWKAMIKWLDTDAWDVRALEEKP